MIKNIKVDLQQSGAKCKVGALCRDMREKYLVTYEEMHTDTPPFVDLFTGEVIFLLTLYAGARRCRAFGVSRTLKGATTLLPG